MKISEARKILGIDQDWKLDAVSLERARKAALKRHHPDLGGDEALFKKVPLAVKALTMSLINGFAGTPRKPSNRKFAVVTQPITIQLLQGCEVHLAVGTMIQVKQNDVLSVIYVAGQMFPIPTETLKRRTIPYKGEWNASS